MTAQENIHAQQDDGFDGIKENRTRKPPVYFNILFYGLIIWGILFSAYFLLSGWSSHEEFQQKMDAHQEKISQEYSGADK